MTELLNTLYVQTPGASLHLDGDAVRVALPEGGPRRPLPLLRLESIVVMGNIQVSSQLLGRCADDGRPVVWMSQGGRFRFRTGGPTRGNVLLRHAQHLAHADPGVRVEIARACLAGKIQNSRQILLKGARDSTTHKTRLRAAAEDLAGSLESAGRAGDVETLMGVEGNAARTYFEAFALLVRPETGFVFPGRVKRPPTDPVNALLSFLYGLVRSMVHGACEQVGLDPYVGFLHGIRPGKPALALDLMEEFRSVLADRAALTLINRRQIDPEDFETLPGGAVQLTEEGRKTVLGYWQQQRAKEYNHRVLGRQVPAALLPSVQARLMARHLRKDLPGYLPWTV
ncbi:CRISPR-associated protein, Cas1 family [Marinactinospora thermotolerans DSM 45154]|uniref:CRISPR-associated endonuclease Cas1 n=1 Tax=Marinactinospora thermotolerans DSM 45154 TaxID=1122192 RepID=A0A1T4T7R2_9ACTN|nr:type I-C CRISPR-associated endonuclease Cas1c [Marinactinospora thermotolerans]SKA36560.1 CRISPR-associated protein, Cas1 family [Marinactinospora thermotolerans DSM 45154]